MIDRVFLEECRDRLLGLIDGYYEEMDALSEFFNVHGAEHSQENCPEDDTCTCPEHVSLREAQDRMGRRVELAFRRIDKINKELETMP